MCPSPLVTVAFVLSLSVRGRVKSEINYGEIHDKSVETKNSFCDIFLIYSTYIKTTIRPSENYRRANRNSAHKELSLTNIVGSDEFRNDWAENFPSAVNIKKKVSLTCVKTCRMQKIKNEKIVGTR